MVSLNKTKQKTHLKIICPHAFAQGYSKNEEANKLHLFIIGNHKAKNGSETPPRNIYVSINFNNYFQSIQLDSFCFHFPNRLNFHL